MNLLLKPLKNLTDNFHKADYKSGGNYQNSYYRFLEEGGTRAPEAQITSEALTCKYILTHTIIPFSINVRTHNKLVGSINVTTRVGDTIHTSEQFADEAYVFTFNADAFDVAENKSISMTFKGFNKFDEESTYTLVIPYSIEEDCYNMGCESNSNTFTLMCDASGLFNISINGKRYISKSLAELEAIAIDNNLSVKFYRREQV